VVLGVFTSASTLTQILSQGCVQNYMFLFPPFCASHINALVIIYLFFSALRLPNIYDLYGVSRLLRTGNLTPTTRGIAEDSSANTLCKQKNNRQEKPSEDKIVFMCIPDPHQLCNCRLPFTHPLARPARPLRHCPRPSSLQLQTGKLQVSRHQDGSGTGRSPRPFCNCRLRVRRGEHDNRR
jgi:hypothetical protein